MCPTSGPTLQVFGIALLVSFFVCRTFHVPLARADVASANGVAFLARGVQGGNATVPFKAIVVSFFVNRQVVIVTLSDCRWVCPQGSWP